MTKKLTAVQKEANKRARKAERAGATGNAAIADKVDRRKKLKAAKPTTRADRARASVDKILDKVKRERVKREAAEARADRMPTGTAKERAQKEVVALFDKGGTVTHDVAAIAATEQPKAGVLDMGQREQPLKGVRGRIAPKPAPAKPARSNKRAADAPAKERKYIDHGAGAPHRFSGIMWDSSRVRTGADGSGLERSTDGGSTWSKVDAVFSCPNGDRWRRALQQAAREKSLVPPNAAIGAKRAQLSDPLTSEKPKRQRKAKIESPTDHAGVVATEKPKRERTARAKREDSWKKDEAAWEKEPPVVTCEWGRVAGIPCKSTSTKRIVCNAHTSFADLCDKHTQQALATKAPSWQGCTSYQLTPTGPKIPAPVSSSTEAS